MRNQPVPNKPLKVCIYYATTGHFLDQLLSSTIYMFITTPLHRLHIYRLTRYSLQSPGGCIYCCTACAFVGRSIEYGPQSSKGCICCCTTCVFTSLLGTAYNNPRDAFIAAPLALLLNYWSRYTNNHPREASVAAPLVHAFIFQVRSTIIYWMRLLMHHLCMHRSIGSVLQSSKECICCYTACAFISLSSMYGLQSSKGCVYGFTACTCISPKGCVCCLTACAFISLLGTIYNHPRDASMAAPIVHVPVHRVRVTIVHGMRL